MELKEPVKNALEVLRAIPTPKATSSYQPVSYSTLVESLLYELSNTGYETLDIDTSLNKDKSVMRAYIRCLPYNTQDDPDFIRTIGVLTSHDKSRSVSLSAGVTIKICLNGMVTGDIVTVRKHTKYVWGDIINNIKQCVSELDNSYIDSKKFKQISNGISISNTLLPSALVGIMYSEGILTTLGQINYILDMYKLNKAILNKEAENIDNKPFLTNTMWDFYNWCTDALKYGDLRDSLDAHKKLHDRFKWQLERMDKHLVW